METVGCAAARNAAPAYADDDVATNAADATNDGARVAGAHDGAAAAIRRDKSVQPALLTGRGGF